VKLRGELAEVTRVTETGSFESLDRERFVRRLLSYRGLFALTPNVKFYLVRIYPAERGRMQGPWHGECLLRFWGSHRPGKPAEVELRMTFVIDRPTKDQDGKKPFVRGFTLLQTQVGKAEKFLFREVAKERGIDPELFHDN
jgi:hypothetical protein